MVKNFDLDKITELAASGAYGGNRYLSPASEVIILCSGSYFSNLRNWKGAGDELTTDEIDEIEDLGDQLQFEAMTGSEGGVGNYVKIAETVVTSPVASVVLDNFESGSYQAYELYVSGLKGNAGSTWIEDVKLQFNEDATSANYYTLAQYQDLTTQLQWQAAGDYPGHRLYFASSTAIGVPTAIGHFKMQMYAPKVADYKYMQYRGTPSYAIPGMAAFVNGSGVWKIEDDIESIEIFPGTSTLFDVDPGESDKPSELRMTLYGMS